ncbi:hypothetical protein [Patiriisocius marinus]|uniref:Uncharacterized protein n=1 Tax=Patiriisocius marinus TaxID=1397112 RepID=A0A5J4J4C4_9FLAO|nr:hypothetical protein [Patiriisocius marinus]GER60743.1 hypothetical protein ULMA_28510 [Patiriisocius marinus]
MKNINKFLSLAFVAVLASATFTSCEDEDKARVIELGNGGFVKFVTAPVFEAGADPATASFDSAVEDPNETAALYEITVRGDFAGATLDTLAFRSTTTFPFDIGFTASDMASLFGVDASTFAEDDSFEFFGKVTTVDGVVYDGSTSAFISPTPTDPEADGYLDPSDPDFVPEPGQWNMQNSDGVLVGVPGLLAAYNWEVTFEDPAE